MIHILTELEINLKIMLIFTLILICIYEGINGFHDASNSVVTVIYTCALQAKLAVTISGIFNFLGVTFSGLSVAYTIIHLLPTQLIIYSNANHILAMVFSMLSAAIVWNLSTWYLRLPTSSSHTLIGTLIGIALINTITIHNPITHNLNIQKLTEILLSLIISPIIGLILAKFIMLILCQYWKNDRKTCYIHMTPSEHEKTNGKRQPPFLLRTILILSSAGVSFSHGANDGQKGIGLIMLLLIGVIPTSFIINMNSTQYDIERTRLAIIYLHKYYTTNPINNINDQYIEKIHQKLLNENQIIDIKNHITPPNNITIKKKKDTNIQNHKNKQNDISCNTSTILNIINNTLLLLNNIHTYNQLSPYERSQLRCSLLCIIDMTNTILQSPKILSKEKVYLNQIKKNLLHTIEYAPLWIIIIVAISLSLGTIIGWKRVAITIGKKIGKKDMTYAQGLTTQITTAISIGIASYSGMPVSTTHILSSSMTGSMLVQGYGVQNKTIKNILISWILTLPISIILSSVLYWIILKLFF